MKTLSEVRTEIAKIYDREKPYDYAALQKQLDHEKVLEANLKKIARLAADIYYVDSRKN